MGNPPRLSAPDPDAAMRPLRWSSKEKTIARRAFDRALARKLKTGHSQASDRPGSLLRALPTHAGQSGGAIISSVA